jgi:hypothetical protein
VLTDRSIPPELQQEQCGIHDGGNCTVSAQWDIHDDE